MYSSTYELPARVRELLPHHAQLVYLGAFNTALSHYGAERTGVAHRIAWAAVERQYVQRGAGSWRSRAHAA